ncbi:hypothetical protein [Desulfobacula sp.]
MSNDFCKGCGMLLSPHTNICSVCGFNNNYENYSDIEPDIDELIDLDDEFAPENYPGF